MLTYNHNYLRRKRRSRPLQVDPIAMRLNRFRRAKSATFYAPPKLNGLSPLEARRSRSEPPDLRIARRNHARAHSQSSVSTTLLQKNTNYSRSIPSSFHRYSPSRPISSKSGKSTLERVRKRSASDARSIISSSLDPSAEVISDPSFAPFGLFNGSTSSLQSHLQPHHHRGLDRRPSSSSIASNKSSIVRTATWILRTAASGVSATEAAAAAHSAMNYIASSLSTSDSYQHDSTTIDDNASVIISSHSPVLRPPSLISTSDQTPSSGFQSFTDFVDQSSPDSNIPTASSFNSTMVFTDTSAHFPTSPMNNRKLLFRSRSSRLRTGSTPNDDPDPVDRSPSSSMSEIGFGSSTSPLSYQSALSLARFDGEPADDLFPILYRSTSDLHKTFPPLNDQVSSDTVSSTSDVSSELGDGRRSQGERLGVRSSESLRCSSEGRGDGSRLGVRSSESLSGARSGLRYDHSESLRSASRTSIYDKQDTCVIDVDLIPPNDPIAAAPFPLSPVLSEADLQASEIGAASFAAATSKIDVVPPHDFETDRQLYHLSYTKLSQLTRPTCQRVQIANLMLQVLSLHSGMDTALLSDANSLEGGVRELSKEVDSDSGGEEIASESKKKKKKGRRRRRDGSADGRRRDSSSKRVYVPPGQDSDWSASSTTVQAYVPGSFAERMISSKRRNAVSSSSVVVVNGDGYTRATKLVAPRRQASLRNNGRDVTAMLVEGDVDALSLFEAAPNATSSRSGRHVTRRASSLSMSSVTATEDGDFEFTGSYYGSDDEGFLEFLEDLRMRREKSNSERSSMSTFRGSGSTSTRNEDEHVDRWMAQRRMFEKAAMAAQAFVVAESKGNAKVFETVTNASQRHRTISVPEHQPKQQQAGLSRKSQTFPGPSLAKLVKKSSSSSLTSSPPRPTTPTSPRRSGSPAPSTTPSRRPSTPTLSAQPPARTSSLQPQPRTYSRREACPAPASPQPPPRSSSPTPSKRSWFSSRRRSKSPSKSLSQSEDLNFLPPPPRSASLAASRASSSSSPRGILLLASDHHHPHRKPSSRSNASEYRSSEDVGGKWFGSAQLSVSAPLEEPRRRVSRRSMLSDSGSFGSSEGSSYVGRRSEDGGKWWRNGNAGVPVRVESRRESVEKHKKEEGGAGEKKWWKGASFWRRMFSIGKGG
ncbi:hypothetical protein BJ742DRAFT_738057 [Cladochytrium replicatum]|nr:hypothetical protein BJ742DRAFT_738057 [Cladochytrium replicatum]